MHPTYMYFEWVPPPKCVLEVVCITAFARVQIQYTLDIHDTTITPSDTPNQSNQLSKEDETSSITIKIVCVIAARTRTCMLSLR